MALLSTTSTLVGIDVVIWVLVTVSRWWHADLDWRELAPPDDNDPWA